MPGKFLRFRDAVDSYTHTHGAESEGYNDEHFSLSGDIPYSEKTDKPVGLVTPGGSVRIYDPNTDIEIKIDAPNVPSDLNSGNDRVTNVDPSSGEDSPHR